MVQRLDLVGDMDGNCNLNEARMEKSDDGIYVYYCDYKELDDRFQDYVIETEMEVAELVARLAEVNAELQKYKDQFPDYVEFANCRSVTHVEGVEDAMGQSGCRKEDAQECEHVWNRYIVHPHRKICLVCGVKE